MIGKIHSFQTMGGADGPGIRFVVFMQGCPLRCAYCHNPDTQEVSGGTEYSAEEVAEKILRYRPYFGAQGGVTVSGGEPLMQCEFLTELFGILRREGVHTALDTSGAYSGEGVRELLSVTDLVICDIKFPTEELYKKYCGGGLNKTLTFLRLTEELSVPLWVRHVVVPGLTDSEAVVGKTVELARGFGNTEKIELLPFRKLCMSKYEEMGKPFLLKDTPECPSDTIDNLNSVFGLG